MSLASLHHSRSHIFASSTKSYRTTILTAKAPKAGLTERSVIGRSSEALQGAETPAMVETHGKAPAQYDQRWHNAWQAGVPPGQKWDVGKPAIAFSQFLDGGFLATQGKVAYVPGCGRGYDVVELAKRGCSATGLDLAPESVEEANKHLQAQQQSASISGTVHFVAGDYFTYRTDVPWVDIGFDHTDWARTWAKVIKPGCHLVTLEFPIRPDDKTGPPWAVSPQIYSDLLVPLGFKNVHFREVDLASMSHPRQFGAGAEVLACWQKI